MGDSRKSVFDGSKTVLKSLSHHAYKLDKFRRKHVGIENMLRSLRNFNLIKLLCQSNGNAKDHKQSYQALQILKYRR